MRDYLKMFLVLGIVALAFMALIFVYGEYTCNNYEALTGTETKHVPWDACYVKVEGRFMRWDEYKAYIVASKGLDKVADL